MKIIHLTKDQLEAGLELIRMSPANNGIVTMIVRRPAIDAREIIQEAELSLETGLIGDTWTERPSRHMPDRSPNPQAQITLMNSRVIALIAQEEERWPLAGDQFFVDLDLSEANLPPGARLSIGSAILEISSQPHTGCLKFSERFGTEAHKFVNSLVGKPLRLRGANARVIQAGIVRTGDTASKV